LANEEPSTISPSAGESIAPNGAVELFAHEIVLPPSGVVWPSASKAYALRVNVPLPSDGRKLVSKR
jgi:hypothetical protein